MSGINSYSCRNDLKTFETVCQPNPLKTPAPNPSTSKQQDDSLKVFSNENNLALPESLGESDPLITTQKEGEKGGSVKVGDYAKATFDPTNGNKVVFNQELVGTKFTHTVTAPKGSASTNETDISGKIGSDTNFQINQQKTEGSDNKRVASLDTAFLGSGTAGLKDEETVAADGNVGRRRSIVASMGKQENFGNLTVSSTQDTGTVATTTNENILAYKTTQISATVRQKQAVDGNFESDSSFEWNSQNEAPVNTEGDDLPKTVSYNEIQAQELKKAASKQEEPAKSNLGTVIKMRQLKTGNADSATTVTTAGVAQKFSSTGTTVGAEQVKTDSAGQGSYKSSVKMEQELFGDAKLSADYTTETAQDDAMGITYDSKTLNLGYTASGGNRAATATYNFAQPEGENEPPQLVSKVGARRSLNLDGKDDTSVFMEGNLPVGSANMSVKTGYSTGDARANLEASLNQTNKDGSTTSLRLAMNGNDKSVFVEWKGKLD